MDKKKILEELIIANKELAFQNKKNEKKVANLLNANKKLSLLLKEKEKKSKVALQENENRFRAYVEQAADALFVHDFNGKFIDVNQRACDSLGYSKEELLTMSVFDVEQDFDLKKAQEAWSDIEPDHHFILFGHQRKKNGTIFPVEVSFGCFIMNDKRYFLGQARDITDRIRAEETLKKSEAQLRKAQNFAKIGSWEFNFNSNQFLWSNGISNIIEIDADELPQDFESFLNLSHPEDREKVNKTYKNAIKTKKTNTIIHRLLLKNNRIKYVHEQFEIFYDNNGKPIRSFGTMQDITEQELAKEKLKSSEEKFSSAFYTSPAAMTIARISDGLFVDANNSFLKFFEYTRDEVIGHTSFELKLIDPNERTKILNEAKEKGGLNNLELILKSKSGKNIHVLISSRLITITGDLCILTTMIDITSRKFIEDALKKSEEEFRTLAESMPQIVWTTRADGWNTYFNQQWMDYTGLSLEESYGHGWNIPFHPNDQQRAWDAWQNAVNNNGKYSIEVRLRRFDGSYRWWLIRGVPILNNKGEILKWFGTCTDIEDIKKAEASIISTKKQLEKISNNIPVLIAQCNATKHYQFVNHQYAEIFGLQPSDIIGKHPREILGTKSYEFASPYMDMALSGNPTHYELAFSKIKGKPIFLNVNYVPDLDETGAVIGFIAAITDISEEKKKAEKLRESEELLRLSTELANVAAWEMDLIANSMTRSSNHDNLYGLKNVGKWQINTFLDATHKDDREKCNFLINKSLAPGGPNEYKFDFRIHYPDQSIHWLNVIGSVIERDSNGVGIKIRGFITDITDQKKAEDALNKLNLELEQRVLDRTSQLEAVNKDLQTFSYSVSHDLKAPLRGIDGYSKLLLELYSENLNEEAQSFIQSIRKGTNQMNKLIEDLLNYSRLEKEAIKVEKVKIKAFLERLKTQFENKFLISKSIIITNIPDIEIVADSNGLSIALRNLIDNAIKFSAKNNNPIIEISLIEAPSYWLITIKDNGIGFDMKYKERIFEIFQQLNLPEDYQGTGIGLAMVSKSIEKMGGKIWAESELGNGATFYLEIPKKQVL